LTYPWNTSHVFSCLVLFSEIEDVFAGHPG